MHFGPGWNRNVSLGKSLQVILFSFRILFCLGHLALTHLPLLQHLLLWSTEVALIRSLGCSKPANFFYLGIKDYTVALTLARNTWRHSLTFWNSFFKKSLQGIPLGAKQVSLLLSPPTAPAICCLVLEPFVNKTSLCVPLSIQSSCLCPLI